MPRKGYKTITVKSSIFYKFTKAVRYAKETNLKIDNTAFLSYLLYLYYEEENSADVTTRADEPATVQSGSKQSTNPMLNEITEAFTDGAKRMAHEYDKQIRDMKEASVE
jgi:hypothetical protein